MSLRSRIPGLASGLAAVFLTVAAQAKPEKPLSVSQWTEQYRFVSDKSQSPAAGKWENARTPYLCEPMDACQLDNGVRRVILTGGAQFGKSEVSLNALAWAIDCAPCGIFVILPSLEEARAYSRLKWEPLVEATERLHRKVHMRVSRSGEGSTTSVKQFQGGSVELFTSGSSKQFQMRTGKVVVAEECSQYDKSEDGATGVGGDVIAAAEVRCDSTAGTDAKVILVSTPAFAGRCRITDEYNASDKGRWFTPCPHCGDAFVLDIKTLDSHQGRPCFSCPSCGGLIEEHHREAMNAAGFWMPTFEHPEPVAEDSAEVRAAKEAKRAANPAPPKIIPAGDIDALAPFDPSRGYRFAVRDREGLPRGYHLWQAQSNLASWVVILEKKLAFIAGRGDPIEYAQKVLGEPYEEVVDRPDVDKLYEARGRVYAREGSVAPWACMVTGFIDVQANRFEWGAYGWGRGGVGHRIRKGIIHKNPQDIASWRSVAELVETEFSGPAYEKRKADYWGIDLGGTATDEVYAFARQHRTLNVVAMKGSSHDRGFAPAYERGKPIKVKFKGQSLGKIIPVFTGTHNLKTRVMHGLMQGMECANTKPIDLSQFGRSLHFALDATKEDFEQLTAEYIKRDDPRSRGMWYLPPHKPNEQLDIAVGCLALAIMEGLDILGPEAWAARYTERMPLHAAQDLTPLEAIMQGKTLAPLPAQPAAQHDDEDGGEAGKAEESPEQPLLVAPKAEGVMSTTRTEAERAALREMGRRAWSQD